MFFVLIFGDYNITQSIRCPDCAKTVGRVSESRRVHCKVKNATVENMSGLRVVVIFSVFIISYPVIACQRVQKTICTRGSAFHTAGERKILHSEKSKTLCTPWL